MIEILGTVADLIFSVTFGVFLSVASVNFIINNFPSKKNRKETKTDD